MKRIMIYGDSITWGRIPGTTERFDASIRFPGVVTRTLGNEYEVIEEGLRARMLSGENPNFENRDGLKQFGPIYGSHVPLDLVVIMLGTNDTNADSAKSVEDIFAPYTKYQDELNKWSDELACRRPELLLVSPPLIVEEYLNGDPMFTGAEQKTKDMSELLAKTASELGAHFFDGSIVAGVKTEGVHIDEAAHQKLGEALATKIKELRHYNFSPI